MSTDTPFTDRVCLPGRETGIRIGQGLREALWSSLGEGFPHARNVGLVVDANVARLWALPAPPDELAVCRVEVPAGEAAKTRAVLASIQDAFIDLRRDEAVVVVGGGATLDVGGFAAATVRRGLPWVAVPTTVIAMADASVGGKVAVNHPRGKNLLGTFHPPRLVLADVDYLSTLPERDVVSGLAEIYKCARIGDPDLLAKLQRGRPKDASDWMDALHRSVAVKARIVERDERDEGERRLLNYGHTLGHALERVLGPEAMRHGEAVAIGMHAAARVAVARGLLSPSAFERQAATLQRLGLPSDLPESSDRDQLWGALTLDKKRVSGARHTLVLPVDDGTEVRVFGDATDEELRTALLA